MECASFGGKETFNIKLMLKDEDFGCLHDDVWIIWNREINPTTILAISGLRQILNSGVNPTTILAIDGLKQSLNSGVNPTTIQTIDGLKQILNSGINPTTIQTIDGSTNSE